MKGYAAAVKLCDITHDGEAEAAARHRFIAALAALEGQDYSRETVKAAEDTLESDLIGIVEDLHASTATKSHLARVLVGRVLSQLVGSEEQ